MYFRRSEGLDETIPVKLLKQYLTHHKHSVNVSFGAGVLLVMRSSWRYSVDLCSSRSGVLPGFASSLELILASRLLLRVHLRPPEQAGLLFPFLLPSPVLLLPAWASPGSGHSPDTCFLQPLPCPYACLHQNQSKVCIVVSHSFSVVALPRFIMITCFSFSLNESMAHICVSGFSLCLSFSGSVTKLRVALDPFHDVAICAYHTFTACVCNCKGLSACNLCI